MSEIILKKANKNVAKWLYLGVFMLIIQIVLGGITRLTESGLSITEWNPITGALPPLNTAQWQAEFAKYKGTDQVTLCFFGEAAVNQGIFHESLNMAQLWKLPCIYICENNQYGMGTSQKRAMSVSSVSRKGEAYGIANEFVDGMDVMAVREATLRAIERARKESLPTLLEIRAYRFMGHSMSDPGNYRSRAEIAKYQERDLSCRIEHWWNSSTQGVSIAQGQRSRFGLR